MKRYRLALLLIAFIVITSLLLPGTTGLAQSDQTVIIKVAPETIQVAPGETTQFAIEIKNARDLYAFDVQLTFDPDVIEIVDANPNQDGVQMSQGTFFDPGFVIRNIADNEAGKLHYAMTQLNPSEAKSGDGVLVVVEIRGKTANTTSPLTITKGEVAQRTGQKLPTTLLSGEAEVALSGSTSPTVTPIPTQNPGTPLPTVAPTATPSNPTPTSQPTATPAPTDTPVPTNTPSPQATPTKAEATPTPLPPTATRLPSTQTPTPTQTLAPATATPTAIPAATHPPATYAPTTVVAAVATVGTPPSSSTARPAIGVTPPVTNEKQSANSNLLLYLGLGLLAMAIIIGVAIVIIWRQSTT